MTIYDKAPKEAEEIAKELIETCEELAPLKECGMTYELSFARGKPKKDGTVPDAITHQGHKALGLASKFKPQDRVHGKPDCRVTVDADWWDSAPDEQRRSLLFHEFYHFDPKVGEDLCVCQDSAGRPVINMRKHDVQVGWFWAPVRRFGASAMESIQFKEIVESGGQILLPSMFGARGTLLEKNEETADADKFHANVRQLAAATKKPAAEDGTVTISAEGMEPITMSHDKFKNAARQLAALGR